MHEVIIIDERNTILKLVRKCLTGQVAQFFKNYFTFNRNVVKRVTRQSGLLHLPRVRLELAKKSFYYHGCVVFNR